MNGGYLFLLHSSLLLVEDLRERFSLSLRGESAAEVPTISEPTTRQAQCVAMVFLRVPGVVFLMALKKWGYYPKLKGHGPIS